MKLVFSGQILLLTNLEKKIICKYLNYLVSISDSNKY